MIIFPRGLLFSSLACLCFASNSITYKSSHKAKARDCQGQVHHVHLAVGPDPATSMTVSFASAKSHQAPVPVAGVALGTLPGRFQYLVMDDEPPASYHVRTSEQESNGPPSNSTGRPRYWSPYYHHITITNLKPDTLYYYQPMVAASRNELKLHSNLRQQSTSGETLPETAQMEIQVSTFDEIREEVGTDPDLAGEGERRLKDMSGYVAVKPCPASDKIRWFKTAPSSPSETRIAVFGDLGQTRSAKETLDHIHKTRSNLDLALLVGDIAYTGQDENNWDCFFDLWDDADFSDRIPVHICPGNHDVDKQKHGNKIFLAYEHRFRMPRIQPPELGAAKHSHISTPKYPLPYEYGNAYYEFTHGAARIFMLSAYSAMETGSKQHAWLKGALQNVDRDRTPWVIVGIHVPLYNTFNTHNEDAQVLAAIEHFEPLFVENEVNFVFTGHVHAYMRSKPVRMGKVHPKGPIHMIVGSSGLQVSAWFEHMEKEDFVEARDETRYGYGVLHIHNKTTAAWEWIDLRYSRDVNRVKDLNTTVPPEFEKDSVILQNQYFL
mgnify:CR=1 FL=1